MFVGHFAVGLAAKPAAPRTSIGTLVLAALLADLLVWAFVVAGIEHIAIKPGITATNALDLYDYPLSHSLLMDVVWGALLAGGYYAIRKYSRGAWLIFAAVVSHWVLDWITHRPDMPLAPGIYRYFGLGLFNSRPGMLIVEGGIWLAGIVIYERATRSRGRAGMWVFYVVVALLTWLWIGSLNGAPPPVSPIQIGKIDVVAILVLVAWAYWVDSLREPTVHDSGLASPGRQAG
jgi:hypothetical protein